MTITEIFSILAFCSSFSIFNCKHIAIKDNEKETMIAFILGTALGMIIGVTVTLLVLEDVDKL